MAEHDIVVIGISAGGLSALKTLVAGLPPEFPAAVFVVQHTSAKAPGMLPQILDQVSTMPVVQAIDGEPIQPRRIYLARPDHHMLVARDRVRVVRGPQENGVRPAIDVLFRSAAAEYGPRVIGVILTGMLSDGTLGLRAVKQRRGIAVVQDPKEAEFPGMPRSAQRTVAVDYCLPVADIPALLGRLVTESVAEEEVPMPDTLALEVQITEQELTSQELLVRVERIGTRTTYTCPECNGSLWQVQTDDLLRFRCHVGHAYTAEAWDGAQTEHLEQALWSAVRVMEEKIAFARQMADRRARQGLAAGAKRYSTYVEQLEQEVALIRELILKGTLLQQLAVAETDNGAPAAVPTTKEDEGIS